jgi:hypothetical protein
MADVIYSHLACSDGPDEAVLMDSFLRFTQQFWSRLGCFVHSVIRVADPQVQALSSTGIILSGYSPSSLLWTSTRFLVLQNRRPWGGGHFLSLPAEIWLKECPFLGWGAAFLSLPAEIWPKGS